MIPIPVTAQVLRPTPITDAMLTSSTVPETTPALWVAATTYAVGYQVRRPNHRVYEALVAGADATLPEDAAGAAIPRWLDVGPTNRWAMFDDVIGTVTTATTALTVVLRPGPVSGVSLLELVGRTAQITHRTGPGGAVVYDRTLSLDASIVQSFYDWFFAEYEQRTDVVLTDLPLQYATGELTISITATGAVACGVCKVGPAEAIGGTLAGARVGIVDYSVKERDEFGRYSVVQRDYSKTMSLQVRILASDFNRLTRRLAQLRATPCLWIGSSSVSMEPLRVYGFFRDLSITVDYLTHYLCELEIEGLI